MANQGLCEVMSDERVPQSAPDAQAEEELKSLAETWRQTAAMSEAGGLCSLEIKTSQSSSSISWSTSGESSSENSQGTAARISSVIVPRRTLKIATGQRAKAVCEKLANQSTQGAGCNALADTVASVSKPNASNHLPAETLPSSEVPEEPLTEHRI